MTYFMVDNPTLLQNIMLESIIILILIIAIPIWIAIIDRDIWAATKDKFVQ